MFNQYGNRYFFSELWTSDGTERRVTPGKLEQELKVGAAGKHTGPPVAIEVTGTK
jgi:hypothetical protein